MVNQVAYLLQPKNKRGTNEKKASLKVPNAQVRNIKTSKIAALFKKGDNDGNKKTGSAKRRS